MSSAKIQTLIADLKKGLGAASGQRGTLKFDFGPEGSIFIDMREASVSDGEGKTADTTVSVAYETFEKLKSGDLDQTSAFMQGKLRVLGDMALAMKLGPMLQKVRG